MSRPINDELDALIADALRRRAAAQPITPRGIGDVRRRATRRRRRVATTGAAAVLTPAVIGMIALSQRDGPAQVSSAAADSVDESSVASRSPITNTVAASSTTSPRPILQTEFTYVVQEGDYPSTVVSKFHVPFEDFMTLNGFDLDDNGFLPQWRPGLVVKIPTGAKVPAETSSPSGPTTTLVITEGFRCHGAPAAVEGPDWYFTDCDPITEPHILGTAPLLATSTTSTTTT